VPRGRGRTGDVSSAISTAGNFLYTRTLMALLRSVATVGSYTLVSRIFGFLRDILTAALLGAGPVADAFFVALRLPNLFRSLFAEGAFSAAFVPLFAGTMAQSGKAEARLFAEDVLAVLLTALLAFVLVCEIFMPAVMSAIAPGFSDEPGKFRLAVELARINFPYLLFIALVALQGGVLNSLDRFAAPAATPIFLNLFLIAVLLLSKRFDWHDGHALAWAVCAAGFAQFLWLMFSCSRAGVALRLPVPRLTAGVRRTLAIMAPGAFGAGVTQINLLISTMLASTLASGSVSFLYYADRLNQFPLGVVGIAVGTAILPPLSRQLRHGDLGAAIATQNRGLELALLLTLPAAIALAALAVPILAVLFQRGAFGPADTAATANALAAYAAGLPAFVLVKVVAPAFFARHDTRTPVNLAVAAMIVNLSLTLMLMRPLAHVGIALATSAAGWINALGLLALLVRRGHFALDRRARRNLPRIAAAALAMGGTLRLLLLVATPALAGTTAVRIAALAGLVGAGFVVFVLVILALGVADWRELLGRRRRQPA
jgi:putative peptidoglycan lipid II flippase